MCFRVDDSGSHLVNMGITLTAFPLASKEASAKVVVYHGKSGCLLLSLVAGSTLLAADSAEAPTTSFKAKACSPLHLKANTGSPL